MEMQWLNTDFASFTADCAICWRSIDRIRDSAKLKKKKKKDTCKKCDGSVTKSRVNTFTFVASTYYKSRNKSLPLISQ